MNTKLVVDFGCGKGTWLRAAQENGALYLQGYDGPWTDNGDMEFLNLHKPCESTFNAIDFEEFLSRERCEGKKFDLAMSLEVIEHLSDGTGRALISWLCQSSDVVLFTCAIPGQGGTNHINEKWLSYWIPQFKEHGFQPWDFLRPKNMDRSGN